LEAPHVAKGRRGTGTASSGPSLGGAAREVRRWPSVNGGANSGERK
jgi:hypothetical protein